MSTRLEILGQLRGLVHALDDEENAAFDLWTWLPSYKAAQKGHEDYEVEFRPSVADVMKEAAEYLAYIRENHNVPMGQEGVLEVDCPCGESHDAKPVG